MQGLVDKTPYDNVKRFYSMLIDVITSIQTTRNKSLYQESGHGHKKTAEKPLTFPLPDYLIEIKSIDRITI